MDISAFFTQQTNTGKAGTPSAQSAGIGGNGLFSGGLAGVSFMDMIFARTAITGENIEGNIAAATTGENAQNALDSDILSFQLNSNGNFETDTLIDTSAEGALQASIGAIMKDMLTAQNATEHMNKIGEQQNAMNAKIEGNVEKLNAFLKRLMAGTPNESAGTQTNVAMIAANLDVQDLNTIKTALKNGEAIPEELMVAAFTMAMPPQTSRKDAILLPRGNVATGGANNALGDLATPAQIASQQKSMDDLAASLNSLIVDSGYKGGNDFDIGFDDILRVFEQAQTKGGTENALLAQNLKNNAQAANAPSALNSAVQNLPLPMNGMNGMSDSFSMDSIFPEGFDFASLSSSGGQSLNAQIAQMTSMVSHVQQAGYPHPATQHVAVNIAKAAQNGDTDITIRLDPPDLGRVQIKMMIAADKKVQAVMLIEKPETFLMLQRDAQMLEKALQDAGLDVSGDSLNFELAQDGNLFDHDQKDQNGNSGAGGGKGGESAESEDLDIIETTMDWYVDPQTGLTRYNLLV